MTGRILRIELRRSAAVHVGLLVATVGAGLLLVWSDMYAGRWMQLAVATRLNLLATLPLALAGGAWLARRDRHDRVDELFTSTVRPRWRRALPTAAALAIALITAYLLTLLVGAARVAPVATYLPVSALVVAAVGALSVVAAGWLGMAAGRAVPRTVTAPALAVVGAVLVGVRPMLVNSPGPQRGRIHPMALLTPIHDGNIDDFQTMTARVDLAQALWLAALATTGLLLLGAVRRRAMALAVLPAVLGAAVAVPLLPAGGYHAASAVEPDAVALVCDDNGPQVCLSRVHAFLLPDVVGPTRRALARLAAKLPDAPTRAEETTQVQFWARTPTSPAPARHRADTLVLDLGTKPADRAAYADESFQSLLFEAAWQQECGTTGDEEAYLVREVAAAWLQGRPDGLDKVREGAAVDAYRALVALPPAEQSRRMATAREAALACRPVTLASLLPGEAQ